jgi:hypothetical protein
MPSSVECQHLQDGTCKLASAMTGFATPTTQDACIACLNSDRPRDLNTVVCSIAYMAKPTPEIMAYYRKVSSATFNKPGSCLRAILRQIGVSKNDSCGCDEYAAKMDGWGSDGCDGRRLEIAEHLNSQSVSWFDMAKVAIAGYLTTESLVNAAICRSRKKG